MSKCSPTSRACSRRKRADSSSPRTTSCNRTRFRSFNTCKSSPRRAHLVCSRWIRRHQRALRASSQGTSATYRFSSKMRTKTRKWRKCRLSPLIQRPAPRLRPWKRGPCALRGPIKPRRSLLWRATLPIQKKIHLQRGGLVDVARSLTARLQTVELLARLAVRPRARPQPPPRRRSLLLEEPVAARPVASGLGTTTARTTTTTTTMSRKQVICWTRRFPGAAVVNRGRSHPHRRPRAFCGLESRTVIPNHT
jgi:hypothetical protein